MNSKKANRLFLSVVLLHFMLVVILIVGSPFFSLGIIGNLLVSQSVILLPAFISLLSGKEKIRPRDLGFHRIKISTVFLVALYTILCMPLVTVVNAISMLFVDNTVVALSSDILALPFGMSLFMMAIFGPLSEEFVFRGILFNSYRKEGNALGAILLSALTFGFMHMNFNQAGYAFVIGIALALVMVATNSIWAPVIMHFIINAQSVVMMYVTEYLMPGSFAAESASMTKEELLMAIGAYSIIAAVTTVLATCLLIFIAGNEGCKEELKNLLVKPEGTKCRMTPALVIALIFAFAYMVLEVVLMMLV